MAKKHKTKKAEKKYFCSWAPYGDKSYRNYQEFTMSELKEALTENEYEDLRVHVVDKGTPVKFNVTITGIK